MVWWSGTEGQSETVPGTVMRPDGLRRLSPAWARATAAA